MNIKLLATDLDGTLLNSENRITSIVKLALEEVIKRGIFVVPATGRGLYSIDPEILNIDNLQYVITCNGSSIYDIKKEKLIYSDPIPLKRALNVIDILKNYNVCFGTFIEGKIYVSNECYENPAKYGVTPEMIKYFKTSRIPVDDVEQFIKSYNKPIDKIFVVIKPEHEYGNLKKDLLEFDGTSLTSSSSNNIEILNSTVNKGVALNFLCDKLNISPDNIIAFGDSPNDIEMMEFVKYPVAMANAVESIKNICSYKTLSNNENGVAYAIKKYIL